MNRQALTASFGALLGLLASIAASAALSVWIGKPIAGCACITLGTAFGVLGFLMGAAAAEGRESIRR